MQCLEHRARLVHYIVHRALQFEIVMIDHVLHNVPCFAYIACGLSASHGALHDLPVNLQRGAHLHGWQRAKRRGGVDGGEVPELHIITA